MRKQTTLNSPVKINGKAAFSGKPARIVISPAEADTGIVFCYKDNEIPACVSRLAKEENHTTSLSIDGIKIQTTEHLLSAITGMGIDNVRIQLFDDGEIPIIQGTAIDYVASLIGGGVKVLHDEINPIIIPTEWRIEKDDSWAVFSPSQHQRLKTTLKIVFPNPIGHQSFTFTLGVDDYVSRVAWARSFIRSDITKMWENGKSTWELARDSIKSLPSLPAHSPVLCFHKEKWVVPPYRGDEPVIHKMLDFIGDFTLVGRPVFGDVFVHFPGHKFNVHLAQQVLKLVG